LLVCVFTAISYADYDDNPTSTPPTVTSKVIQTKVGNITTDKPQFPEFYIWRRVYQKKGESYFKLFLVKKDGSLKQCGDVPISYGCWHRSVMQSGIEKSSTPSSSTEISSYDSKWSVVIDEPNKMKINFKRTSAGKIQTINIPGFTEGEEANNGWGFIQWNSEKDLFYFSFSGGTTDDRANSYYEFDPENQVFTYIGRGADINFSADGHWVIWSAGNSLAYSDSQVCIYDVVTNRDYVLTNGHSANLFYKWAADVPLEKWSEISKFLDAGKDFYHQKKYEQAIAEYQKAIDLEPENDKAYGYMGYSYYLNGDLDKANQSLQKAIALNPDDENSYYNLALVSLALKDITQSAVWLGELFERNSSYIGTVQKDLRFKEVVNSEKFKQESSVWRH
jgi:hypothetical protein